jgi:hypothetical protein
MDYKELLDVYVVEEAPIRRVGYLLLGSLRTEVFLRKIQKMHFPPKKWVNQRTNGTINQYNSHVNVSMFRQSYIFWVICVFRPR